MKLEKLNDNQIRCILTAKDLADRNLKLSELAYGTEKAKSLFREMMYQASMDYGFEAEDIPVMIEAIPFKEGYVILIITKVEDPDELDGRFSRFSPSLEAINEALQGEDEAEIAFPADFREGLFNLFKRIHEEHLAQEQNAKNGKPQGEKTLSPKFTPHTGVETETEIAESKTESFVFPDLSVVVRLAKVLRSVYRSENTLYKDISEDKYFLVLNKGGHSGAEFNRICNIASEYAAHESFSDTAESYRKEHMEVIAAGDALQRLSVI